MDQFAQTTRPKWQQSTGPFEYLNTEEAKEIQIWPGVNLQTARLGRSTIAHPCGCHHDRDTNCTVCGEIFCCSLLVGSQRIAMNFQQKNSVSSYLHRERGQHGCFQEILEFYHGMEESCKSLGSHLFEGADVELFPDYPTKGNLCCMNPIGYGQPVLLLTLSLSEHLNLSLIEITSIHHAFLVCPDTVEFFQAACQLLLSIAPKRHF